MSPSVTLSSSAALRGRVVLARSAPRTRRATRPRAVGDAMTRGVVVAASAPAKKKIFIDGEAGTTGLQVRDRLAGRDDVEIISLTGDDRKDATKRAEFLNACDAAILCLPDDAAIEAVKLCADPDTVIIDASTAHRVADGWTYGFPELCPGQSDAIKRSKRIANPGCYPTGMIALTRPLVDAGILPRDVGLVVHAVSGYSGGGKQLMAIHQAGDAEPWGAYGFNLAHKHLPEMAEYSGMGREPIFCPAVGAFEQGMVVSVPIHYDQLSAAGRSAAAIQECLEERYAGSRFVRVMPLNETGDLERGAFLRRVRVVELVPIRPRRRGGRRSLRTFLPGVSLRPHLAFNPDTPRRLSTPPDAFQLHPDVRTSLRVDPPSALRPDALNDTNALELRAYASDEAQTVWLMARLDNLGKGASGAAVQNMNLALGLPEDAGL
jgi:N-acetyl-gamma-glutamyl-phosphate reductase